MSARHHTETLALSKAQSLRPGARRAAFLREVLAAAAAGLVTTEGTAAASETVYRLADAIVTADTNP